MTEARSLASRLLRSAPVGHEFYGNQWGEGGGAGGGNKAYSSKGKELKPGDKVVDKNGDTATVASINNNPADPESHAEGNGVDLDYDGKNIDGGDGYHEPGMTDEYEPTAGHELTHVEDHPGGGSEGISSTTAGSVGESVNGTPVHIGDNMETASGSRGIVTDADENTVTVTHGDGSTTTDSPHSMQHSSQVDAASKGPLGGKVKVSSSSTGFK